MERKKIALISTGGTIEKTYDELSGLLENQVSNLAVMLASLELRGIEVHHFPLMKKDSIDMSEDDHRLIADTAHDQALAHDGVVVVHGTDRLENSGEILVERYPELRAPVVFTGAMRPYLLRNTDALQNLTESLMAVQLLPAGVFAVIHNQVLRFPGVSKDRSKGTFTATLPLHAK